MATTNDRLRSVFLVPTGIGFVVAVVLALILAFAWSGAAISDSDLRQDLYDQAMADQTAYDDYMVLVRDETRGLLLAFAAGTWIAMAFWFLACHRTHITRAGHVRELRARWLWTGVLAPLMGILLILLLPFWSFGLLDLVTGAQFVYTLLFALVLAAAIYYLTTFACTHHVYLSAIPLARKRPWLT